MELTERDQRLFHLTGPVRATARGRPRTQERASWFAGMAKSRADRDEAAIEDGSLLGVDKMSGRRVLLTDADANTHTLVLGTTGSGKTVTILNLVESAIDRALPVVYIDGKGDQALAQSVIGYGRAVSPVVLSDPTGDQAGGGVAGAGVRPGGGGLSRGA